MCPRASRAAGSATSCAGELDFRGVVFADDLTMEGASTMGGVVERAEAAIAAGCDVLPVCNRRERA